MVDTFEAKFDYERERDDVLSFQKGEHFEIVNKTNDRWWVAKRVSDGAVGYVPTVYLQTSNFRVIGKLVPEKRRNTREHDIHLQALAELHQKVKPLPAHVIGAALGIPIPSSDEDSEEDDIPTHQRKSVPPPPTGLPPPEPDYDQDEDEEDVDEIPYHHKLNSSGRISSLSSEESSELPSPTSPPPGKSPLDLQHPNDANRLIHPRALANPVLSSQNHQRLHRDLKMSIKTHGAGKVPIDSKPELAKKFQERKRQERIKEWDKEKESRRTSMEVKLMERLKMEDTEYKTKEDTLQGVNEQPEFMRLRLKHTPSKS